MENQFIDVSNVKEQYERTVDRFRQHPEISQHNKELLLRFLRDASLGKTVLNRARKKISQARLMGYINQMSHVMLYLRKDLDHLTQEDMENFIEALESDKIRSRNQRIYGNQRRLLPARLSPRYKVDIKVSLKKFYKWLWGENKTYPKLVEWIDTYERPAEIPSLSEAEIERMLDRCKTTLQRALIQVLFDGGFRIAELLNVRLHHVQLKTIDPQDPSKRCFFVRVPYSKTMPRTVALPMRATIKWLKLWLEDHPARPQIQSDGTLEAKNIDAQLFPMTANAARLITRRAGQRALSKRVYPHLLRHSSATYWSNKLPYFKFCKRFGWTMTSDMPRRYSDREGVDELEVAELYHAGENGNLAKQNQALQNELAQLKAKVEVGR